MLTKHEWKTFSVLFQYIFRTPFFPFDWDVSRTRLHPTSSKIKRFTPYIFLLMTIGYSSYEILRLPAALDATKSSVADLVIHLLCCMWYSTMVMLTYMLDFGCRAEFAAIVNEQMDLNLSQGSIHAKTQYDVPNKRGKVLRLVLPPWFISIFVWTTITAIQRNKTFFIFSALPEEWKRTEVLILVTCGEFLYCSSFTCMMTMLMCIAYIYLVSSNYWLSRLCVQWPKEQQRGTWRGARVDSLNTSFRLYRCLELLNQLFNQCFASVIVPQIKAATILGSSMGAYMVIKHRETMHPLVEALMTVIGFVQLGMLVFMCIAGAKFHDNTKRFHGNYEKVIMQLPLDRQKYYKGVSVACPIFGFRVGSIYVIKKITIASALYVVLNFIMFLLLTY